jgi:hypothetical protein
MNRLAELNVNSCSDAVRAVANFFLDTDGFTEICDDHSDPTLTPRRRDPTPRHQDPAPQRW